MRVLVVEDELALAETIRQGLTAEGYSVATAHAGPAGLAVAIDGEHDVIILDIMLSAIGYRLSCAAGAAPSQGSGRRC